MLEVIPCRTVPGWWTVVRLNGKNRWPHDGDIIAIVETYEQAVQIA